MLFLNFITTIDYFARQFFLLFLNLEQSSPSSIIFRVNNFQKLGHFVLYFLLLTLFSSTYSRLLLKITSN
jgi:hypothetical protein